MRASITLSPRATFTWFQVGYCRFGLDGGADFIPVFIPPGSGGGPPNAESWPPQTSESFRAVSSPVPSRPPHSHYDSSPPAQAADSDLNETGEGATSGKNSGQLSKSGGPEVPWLASPASRPARLAHFAQLAGSDIEHEAAYGVGVRDERARLDPGDRLPHVFVQITERFGGPARLDPGLFLYRMLERVIGERQHAAVSVMDQDDLPGTEQALADGQRADLVVSHHPARVPDHVRFAITEPENGVNVEPGVHARDDSDLPRRRHRQRSAEGLGIARIVGQELVGD